MAQEIPHFSEKFIYLVLLCPDNYVNVSKSNKLLSLSQ